MPDRSVERNNLLSSLSEDALIDAVAAYIGLDQEFIDQGFKDIVILLATFMSEGERQTRIATLVVAALKELAKG